MNSEAVTIRKLVKRYETGDTFIEVLRGLDLIVAYGGFTVITGVSGSGKSTLLHIIGGLDRVDSGLVVCDGTVVSALGEKHLSNFRKQVVGFIFQNHYLIEDLSAVENLVLPGLMNGYDAKHMREVSEHLIDRVGLGGRKHHHPNQLSGGERQRIAVARAFINDPKVILADEPTGNLDERNTELVMAMLVELVREHGKTLVLVTHDMHLAQRGDDIYQLREGVLHHL